MDVLDQASRIGARWFVLLLAVSFLTGELAADDAAEKATRPNVLIVIADDLRNELGCYGSDVVVSPHLDRLADESLVFDRAYCQKALCWPSRNSFFSGLMPHSLGTTDAHTTFRESHPGIASLPQWFRRHGWVTRGFGKILHDGQTDEASWSQPHFFPEPRHYASSDHLGKHPIINRAVEANRVNPLYERAEVEDEAYEDGLTARAARQAIAELATAGRSFFLMVGFHKPHTPFNAPARYWDLYDRPSLPLAPVPDPPSGAPLRHAVTHWQYVRSFQGIPRSGPMPEELARTVRHGYYACISYIDALTGGLVDQLDASGVRDNTIVMFWSDHGYQLGDHSMWSKHTNFEWATHVPLIISVPGAIAAGCRTEALVELVDIYPTLAELCALPLPQHLEGTSFSHLFHQPGGSARAAAFSEFTRGGARGMSIRTNDHRYTEWRSTKSDQVIARELYDYRVDGLEKENIARRPESRSLVERLQHKLRTRMGESIP
jgi:arylsulfatase A-like enzyme